MILNNDTVVKPDFLSVLVKKMEEDKQIGCLQPKLVYLQDKRILNAAGSFFTSTGFLYHYGYREEADHPEYNRSFAIYSAKGAAMLLRKSALQKVGVFDKDYFIFFEETDLCHRLWLAGYKVVYEPKALIYHHEAGDTLGRFVDSRRIYLSFRNRICTYLKNFSTPVLIQFMPIHLAIVGAVGFVYLILLKFDLFYAIIRALKWNVINLSKTVEKRNKIQKKIRKVKDREILCKIKKNPSLRSYIENFYFFFARKARIKE